MEESLLQRYPSNNSDDPEYGTKNDHQPSPSQRSRLKPYAILVTATASLGGLIFGFQLTGAGGTFVMSGFREHFGWACAPEDTDCVPLSDSQVDTERAIISAMLTIGATIGALANAYIVEKWGRIADLKLASFIFIAGALICALAPSIGVMYAGRLVAGFAIGMYALCVPVYIAECSPVDYRGQLMTCWQFGVTTGMLAGQGVNIGLEKVDWGWRMAYSLNGVFAVLMLVGLFTYMPESPRFIASRHWDPADNSYEEFELFQRERLMKVMNKLRYEDDVEHSVESINKEVKEDKELGDASWREVFAVDNKIRYRVFLGIAIQAFNQLSGNEAINFYSPTILEKMFGADDSIFFSFVLGIVNFVAVCVSILTIDRFGRIPLFFVGGITMLFTQMANSVYQSIDDPSDTINNLFFASLAIFSFAYHGTWGPLAWDICGEMFPLRERSKAVGLTTMSNFFFNTIVAASFSFTIEASPSGSFGFFCACIFANLTIAYLFLPETAHKSSAEMDETFMNHEPKLCRGKES